MSIFSSQQGLHEIQIPLLFPKHVKFPGLNSTDFLHQAAIDIISLFTKIPSLTTPILEEGDTTCNHLIQVAESLQRFTAPPQVSDPTVKTPPPVQLPRVEVTPSSSSEFTTPTDTSLPRVGPTSVEVIRPAVVTPSTRVEERAPRTITDKIFQGGKPFENINPTATYPANKVYYPKKLTSLLQQHHSLFPLRQRNYNFRYQAVK